MSPTTSPTHWAASPGAPTVFDGLAPSHRKNVVVQITAAKQPATRERRIATTIQELEAGPKR